MFGEERHMQIMEILRQSKTASVEYLSRTLFASEATIRRDLGKLEEQGFLKRRFGGAVLLEGFDQEIPFLYRETENKPLKESIAAKACEFVSDNDSVILDSSSTVLQMVKFLKNRSRLTIITNGLKTTQLLSESGRSKVYCTGGILRESSLSFVGSRAEKFVEDFQVKTLFFSCRGVSKEGHLTDGNESEAELRRVMMKHATTRILLCDSTKFDQTALMRICDFDAIDYIITDKVLDDDWCKLLAGYNVKVVYGE